MIRINSCFHLRVRGADKLIRASYGDQQRQQGAQEYETSSDDQRDRGGEFHAVVKLMKVLAQINHVYSHIRRKDNSESYGARKQLSELFHGDKYQTIDRHGKHARSDHNTANVKVSILGVARVLEVHCGLYDQIVEAHADELSVKRDEKQLSDFGQVLEHFCLYIK